MEPITLILTALAAGTSAGAIEELTDEVKEKVKASYSKLRYLVSSRFGDAGTPNASGTLADYEEDPDTYEKGLSKKLAAAGAGEDHEILEAAQALLNLLGRQDPKSGKYEVTVTSSKGVQVGDHNIQKNAF